VALLLAMACGYLSWRFVEEPIRRRRWLPTATGLLGTTGAGSLSIVLLAAVTAWGSGFPTRFDSRVIEYMAATAGPGSFARSLQAADVPASDLHAAGNRDAKCRILLLGDSHAMRLMFGLAPLIEKAGCRIDQITRYSTAPLPGFRHVSWNRAGAADFCDAAYQKIQTERWDCVVLAASWYTYVEEDPLLFEALVSGVEKIVASGAKVCLVTPRPARTLGAFGNLGRLAPWPEIPYDPWVGDHTQSCRETPKCQRAKRIVSSANYLLHSRSLKILAPRLTDSIHL